MWKQINIWTSLFFKHFFIFKNIFETLHDKVAYWQSIPPDPHVAAWENTKSVKTTQGVCYKKYCIHFDVIIVLKYGKQYNKARNKENPSMNRYLQSAQASIS